MRISRRRCGASWRNAVAFSADFLAWVLEQLEYVQRVTSRRMFGGVGIYSSDRFFALIDEETVYFKVDDSNRAAFESRGMRPFRPFKDRPEYSMGYYEVPADVIEDRDELAAWARDAIAVAGRSVARRPRARRGGPVQRKPKVARQRRQ
jgi:DNA transformation protein